MAIDVEQQVAYWKDGAREDLAVAELLMHQGRARYALFFGHLALEKSLKALVPMPLATSHPARMIYCDWQP